MMRPTFAAVLAVSLSLALGACNLQSQQRVESINRLNEGIGQLNKNNLSAAEKAMQESIAIDPTHAAAYAALARLYRKQSRWGDAAAKYREAIEKAADAKDDDFYYELGLCVIEQADEPTVARTERDAKYREAIAAFDEAIKLNPKAYKAHYRTGVLYEKLDDPVKADQSFRAAIGINAKYSPSYVALGNMYIDYGHANVAMAILKTGAEANDTDAQMLNGLGRAYLALNQPKEAVEAFKTAKNIDPNLPDVLFGLGMAHAELRQKKEAREALEAFLQKAGQGVPEDTIKAARDTIARMDDVF